MNYYHEICELLEIRGGGSSERKSPLATGLGGTLYHILTHVAPNSLRIGVYLGEIGERK